ncbi:RNA polymerase sigma factor [Dyadobacter sp. MSC1_007]|jgi:RNA polymerase sigma factor (sigma-70 family)|uniref:RNA polymerase sigma factor n=1 Tax=Dyadobacter sp. MSC1_007 TaxID=2909264 RepID=UPI00202EF7A8|nr:sigma-70 family RNA polymerase sigma factor [Dyadobacter sp. MSC1_007]
MTDLQDRHLLLALQEGDEAAFTTIYNRYWYNMFLVAYRKLQNKEVAEELVQEIFLRLWRERANVEIKSLNYYLFSAVRYEVIDQIRAKGPADEFLDHYRAFAGFEDWNTENQIAVNELSRMIDEGLHILPEKSKEIFRLHKFEYWPISRIALHFKISEKAVEYHLTKSVKSVRAYLKEVLILLPALFTFPFH